MRTFTRRDIVVALTAGALAAGAVAVVRDPSILPGSGAANGERAFVSPQDFRGSEHTSGGEGSWAMLRNVGTGQHDGFDRIVITFGEAEGEGMPDWKANVNNRKESLTVTFVDTGSGAGVQIDAPLDVVLRGEILTLSSSGEVPLHSNHAKVTAVFDYSDPEYQAFRILDLADPYRVVIDILKPAQ